MFMVYDFKILLYDGQSNLLMEKKSTDPEKKKSKLTI